LAAAGDLLALASQFDRRLTGRVVGDLDIGPGDPAAPAGAEDLEDSLLGGKAAGDVGQRIPHAADVSPLGLGQHAVEEAVGGALEDFAEATGLDQINSLRDDVHAGEGSGGEGAIPAESGQTAVPALAQ